MYIPKSHARIRSINNAVTDSIDNNYTCLRPSKTFQLFIGEEHELRIKANAHVPSLTSNWMIGVFPQPARKASINFNRVETNSVDSKTSAEPLWV